MAFQAPQLTARGRELMARALTGENIHFASIRMGDATYTGNIDYLTTLGSERVMLPIDALIRRNDTVSIRAVFTNSAVSEGFYWREIGVFVRDPEGGADILYAYQNAGDKADYIAAASDEVIEKVVSVSVISANATNVTASIDASLVYVTQRDLAASLDTFKVDIGEDYQTKTDKLAVGTEVEESDRVPYFDTSSAAHRSMTIEVLAKALQNLIGGGAGIPVAVTSGTGAAFTAEVDRLEALTDGYKITILPHTDADSVFPTLNLNNFGAKTIFRRVAGRSNASYQGSSVWLYASVPVTLTYSTNLGVWLADVAIPSPADVGAMPISGGTFTGAVYAGTAEQTSGSYLLRNQKLSTSEETPTVNGEICWLYE